MAAVDRLLTQFAQANKAHYENGVVFVVKMQQLQHGDISWQIATRIAAEVDSVPDGSLKTLYLTRYGYPIITETQGDKGKAERSVTYRYPIDTPPMEYRYTDTNTDTNTNTDTVSAAPTGAPPAPSFPPEQCKPEKTTPKRTEDPTPHQAMFGAVATVCMLDAELKASRIGKTAKDLAAAGYTPEQVQAFAAWWKTDEWRAAHTPVPTLEQLIEKIPQSVAGIVPQPNHNGNGRGTSPPHESPVVAASRLMMEEALRNG